MQPHDFDFVSADGQVAIREVPSGVFWADRTEKVADEIWEWNADYEAWEYVRTDIPHG